MSTGEQTRHYPLPKVNSNKHLKSSWRVWIFLGTVSVLLMVLGLKLGDRHGLLAGFLIGVAMNAAIFFYGDMRLLKRFHTEHLEGQDPWGLISKLEALSEKAGIPTPRLFLIDVNTPTTLSIGMSTGQNAVLVSQGLVRELTPPELEAALAYEVARLQRHDTAASTAAAAMTAVFSFFANLLDQIFFFQFLRRKKPGQFRFGTFLFSPIIAFLARIAVGRKQYLESDALAANLIDDPQRLARVLWKIHSFQSTRPFDVAPSDAMLFVVSPLGASSWYRPFQIQPSMERRIRLLIGHYPV